MESWREGKGVFIKSTLNYLSIFVYYLSLVVSEQNIVSFFVMKEMRLALNVIRICGSKNSIINLSFFFFVLIIHYICTIIQYELYYFSHDFK